MPVISLRIRGLVALCGSLLAVSLPSAFAQRLPQDVTPSHYSLVLTPDLKAATFTGREEIDVELAGPLSAITLNAVEIQFVRASTKVNGKVLTANVSLDEKKQQATLTFGSTLPAGKYTLDIEYSGILNGQLRGFYLSKTASGIMPLRNLNRPMRGAPFPCFDEPAFKATFDITLVVDEGDTAISNTTIAERHAGATAGKHTIQASRRRRRCRRTWWHFWSATFNARPGRATASRSASALRRTRCSSRHSPLSARSTCCTTTTTTSAFPTR